MFECFNSVCDKQRCCEIMGQCVFTRTGIIDNPAAIEALKRVQNLKKINKILALALPHIQYSRAKTTPPRKSKKKKKPAHIRAGFPFRKAWEKYMQNKTA